MDTNIVFSGILNSSSRIGKILINARTHFRLYSCDFLRIELLKHRNKLLKVTKLPEFELIELETLVTKNISFIHEGLLPQSIMQSAETLLKGIDQDDTPFVALAKHLEAKLWTGDMQLYKGLKSKRFKDVITTAELSLLLNDLEKE